MHSTALKLSFELLSSIKDAEGEVVVVPRQGRIQEYFWLELGAKDCCFIHVVIHFPLYAINAICPLQESYLWMYV